MIKTKALGYVRLSRDEDKENYTSVESQIQIIKDIVDENNFELVNIFIDDNVSGYKFDRDGLNEVRDEIDKGNGKVLVAKDLSRIGRHNAKTLLFLEYLEDNNVRLLLSDYDSDKDDGDIIGIQTWYNEKYVKDISKKITTNLRSRQKTEGLVVKETFGYLKDEKDGQKLIVDEIAAITIRKIFDLYIEGNGYRKVSIALNEEGIPTPSKHINSVLNKTRPESKVWDSTMVKRILENDIYIGVLRSHKTKKKKIKGDTIFLDPDEHFVHKNHHDAIIDETTFNLAQDIIKKRVKYNVRGTSTGINLFAGFLFCGECNSPLFGYKKRGIMRYVCGNYHKHGRKACTSHTVSEDYLIENMIRQFQYVVDNSLSDFDKVNKNLQAEYGKKQNIDVLIKKLNTKLEKKLDEIKSYSKQLAKGLIDEEMFLELTSETKAEISYIEKTLEETNDLKKDLLTNKEDLRKAIEVLRGIVIRQNINRKDLEIILVKIIVYQTNLDAPIGSHAKVDLKIELKNKFASMCYPTQADTQAHWNSAIVEISTKLNEMLKEVI